MVPKIKIEIVVPDQMVTRILETISKTAKTGKIGGEKIFVSPVRRPYEFAPEKPFNNP